MARRYFHAPIEELEELFEGNLHSRQVLGEIWEELTYRGSDRASRLHVRCVGFSKASCRCRRGSSGRTIRGSCCS